SDWITLGSHKVTPYIVVETPKYTSESPQILGAISTCQKLPCFRLDSACRSPANLSSNQARSSPLSQAASSGRSDRVQNTTAPSRIAGKPSIKNIHCHPDNPFPLSPSSAPEIGLPIMPATGFAIMNQATARARAGNQRFI